MPEAPNQFKAQEEARGFIRKIRLWNFINGRKMGAVEYHVSH